MIPDGICSTILQIFLFGYFISSVHLFLLFLPNSQVKCLHFSKDWLFASRFLDFHMLYGCYNTLPYKFCLCWNDSLTLKTGKMCMDKFCKSWSNRLYYDLTKWQMKIRFSCWIYFLGLSARLPCWAFVTVNVSVTAGSFQKWFVWQWSNICMLPSDRSFILPYLTEFWRVHFGCLKIFISEVTRKN